MRRFSAFFFAGAILISLCGCGGGNGIGAITVTFTSVPASVPGGSNFVFGVTTQNDTSNLGANFTLALNEPSNGETTTPCTTACGALTGQVNVVTSSGPDVFTSTTTINYAAPLQPPVPNSIILTATSASNASITATDTFTVGAPEIVVRITNKITNIAPGAAPVTLNAQVQFDPNNAGVSWTLTAAGAACSPACGTLSSPASLSVVYAPPTSLPAPPNNTPTVTATSVTDSTKSSFDDITIQTPAPPISVTITNPFSQIDAGSPGVTLNATVQNDIGGQGVTWSLEPSAQTGALSAEQPLSAIYTPPNTAPQPPNNTPTISATSVADPTKSQSFTFTIEAPQAAFLGPYVFLIRADDGNHNNVVAAGSLTADAGGKITTGELDLNSSLAGFAETVAPLAGRYEAQKSESGAQEIRITLGEVALPNQPTGLTFTATFPRSSAGMPTLSGGGCGVTRASFGAADPISFSATGTIAGRAGPWRFAGEMTRQDLTSAVITSFSGRELSVFLDLHSPAYLSSTHESGSFSLGDDGVVLRGSLSLAGLIVPLADDEGEPPEFVKASDRIVGGNLDIFDTNGRASLALTFGDTTSREFAAYAVSATRLMLVETGTRAVPRRPTAGAAQLQLTAQ